MATFREEDLFSNSAEWLKLYQSALRETNHTKLPQKILDAEAAMFKRKLQLSSRAVAESGAEAERAAINDALLHLVLLRQGLSVNPKRG